MEKTRIRSLILDYGGVISKSQNIDNVNSFLKILEQDDNDFRNVYINKRKNYDNGQLSGEEYWFSILQHYDLEKNDSNLPVLVPMPMPLPAIQLNFSVCNGSRKKRQTVANEWPAA